MSAAPARGQAKAGSASVGAPETTSAAVAPVRNAARRVVSLVPPVESDGPRIRLGIAYGLAAAVLTIVGGAALAIGAAAVGATAATQTARSWGALRPVRYLAFVGGALIPLTALGGRLGIAAGVVATLVAALVLAGPGGGDLSVVGRVALMPIVCGVAAGAPVALRSDGLAGVAVLLACALLYDATVFVMGADAKWRWEGVVPGLVGIVAVMLFAAAVLVPPFRGGAPWIFGGLALVTLPAGAVVGSVLRGPEPRPVPALRRIDSLLVFAPAWLVFSPFLLGG